MVRCPGCQNLHIVCDNLGWYFDKGTHIETMMKESGMEVPHIGMEAFELTRAQAESAKQQLEKHDSKDSNNDLQSSTKGSS